MASVALGQSDPRHLAQGMIEFENLRFSFQAPYRTWAKAKQRGIEARICRLIMSRCPNGGVALDVGTNCGFLSLVMALSVGNGGRVLSFEMDPGFFQILRHNIEANGLDAIVTPILGEVSADAGSVDSAVERFGLPRVDFIKIDVDGGDYDVLRGGLRSLKRFRPVVVVEMTRNQQAILDLLRDEVGYTTLAGMSGEPVDTASWPPNLIAADGPVVIPPPGHFVK